MTDKQTFTPEEYFNFLKNKKNKCTDSQLNEVYENALKMITKYKKTNQVVALKKLIFHLDCIEQEREAIKAGIDTFVYKKDIQMFINNVADKTVKIIELSRYEREIPDEVLDAYQKVKDIFNEFYVVFTDYTGEMEQKVAEERREKDPILFGTFKDKKSSEGNKSASIYERFYYIGDWIDEYCDLTLEQMILETKTATNIEIDHSLKTPEGIEELQEQVNALVPDNRGGFVYSNNRTVETKPFFSKIMTYLTRKINGRKN
ncbi:hypothetical protein [Shouchella clausii]|uniref:hypothetical protein n=1 Tax=Shouchella clausii TaxID=79880 RepID=UPI001C736F2A|nr:hypothetical protein [Shouchella clausii]MBX0320298.1 hypothetical protein [Shouchella clausii]